MFGQGEYKELNSIISNMIRVGKVTSLLPDGERARVVFSDRDNTESYDLQVMVKNTKQNKDYWMPDVDEDVLCLFLPIGIEQGFILGSFYTRANAPEANTENVRRVKFSDGTVIEYDRESHRLLVDVKGDIELLATGNLTANIEGSVSITVGGELTADVAGNSTITTPLLTVNGDMLVDGSVQVTGSTETVGLISTGGLQSSGGSGASIEGNMSVTNGDVTADSISLKQHDHTDSLGGKTSPAQ
ncbi:putative baseplate protein [Vibrio phage phi 2]|nr:putative baseplate protein [Vibrio phage phi 2]